MKPVRASAGAILSTKAKEETLALLSVIMERRDGCYPTYFDAHQRAVSALILKARETVISNEDSFHDRLRPLLVRLAAAYPRCSERAVLTTYLILICRHSGGDDEGLAMLARFAPEELSPSVRWRYHWAANWLLPAYGRIDQAVEHARLGRDSTKDRTIRFFFERRIHEIKMNIFSIEPTVGHGK